MIACHEGAKFVHRACAGDLSLSVEQGKITPLGRLDSPWLRFHYMNDCSPSACVYTEFVPSTDYGEGCRYSLSEHGDVLASWIRDQRAAFDNNFGGA